MTKHEVKKPKLKIGFGIGLGEYSSAIVLGAASGFAGAIRTIRVRFHDDFNNSDIVKKATWEHTKQLDSEMQNELREMAERKGINLPEIPNPFKTADGKKTILSVANNRDIANELAVFSAGKRNEFRLAKDEWRRAHWGIRDGFVQGTLDMINYMFKPVKDVEGKVRRSGTVKALALNTTLSAVFGAAMTLSFFNGMATRAKINAIDNAVEPEVNQPPEEKKKSYKDREALPTAEEKTAAVQKKKDELKHADEIIEGKPALAKEERPLTQVSHVDKLAAIANDNDIARDVANR